MRTMMLIALLLVAVTMTIVFLALVRVTVQRRLYRDLAEDAQRSEVIFVNLQAQRRHLLERTAALMADLPSLKALLSARDSRTIADGGAEFWRVSGSSFFALSNQSGELVSFYNDSQSLEPGTVRGPVALAVEHPGKPYYFAAHGRLMEILSQPVEFGSEEAGSRLGYVTLGYALDRAMAKEVGDAAAAQVVFVGVQGVVASTLSTPQTDSFVRSEHRIPVGTGHDLWLGKERFLARSVALSSSAGGDGAFLVVLKSYAEATSTLRQLNFGIALIGLLGLAVGSALGAAIARTVTRPLESLLEGTRALGAGDFRYQWPESGALEVRGLSGAFRRMQGEMERAQRELLLAEQMATIGRMASSISHDLRHYLTSMYANAEFLSMAGTSVEAREEMLDEVKTAVVGMTDLLDSLLVFGRPGIVLHKRIAEMTEILDRAVARVRTHPEARGVDLEVHANQQVQVVSDPQELDRAIYNLLLNACQAAKQSGEGPRVIVTARVAKESIRIEIEDNGPGVPIAIRDTLFQPFVSEGKANGTGLGLALSARIIEAHGGSLGLVESVAGKTIFCLSLHLHSVGTDRITPPHPLEETL